MTDVTVGATAPTAAEAVSGENRDSVEELIPDHETQSLAGSEVDMEAEQALLEPSMDISSPASAATSNVTSASQAGQPPPAEVETSNTAMVSEVTPPVPNVDKHGVVTNMPPPSGAIPKRVVGSGSPGTAEGTHDEVQSDQPPPAEVAEGSTRGRARRKSQAVRRARDRAMKSPLRSQVERPETDDASPSTSGQGRKRSLDQSTRDTGGKKAKVGGQETIQMQAGCASVKSRYVKMAGKLRTPERGLVDLFPAWSYEPASSYKIPLSDESKWPEPTTSGQFVCPFCPPSLRGYRRHWGVEYRQNRIWGLQYLVMDYVLTLRRLNVYEIGLPRVASLTYDHSWGLHPTIGGS